jgi:hypothetical protein
VAQVATAERLHGARQAVGAARRHQQVHVVGHQHIGVNGAAAGGGRIREPTAVAVIVGHGKEDRLAIVAALNDMQRLVRQEITSLMTAGHGLA